MYHAIISGNTGMPMERLNLKQAKAFFWFNTDCMNVFLHKLFAAYLGDGILFALDSAS